MCLRARTDLEMGVEGLAKRVEKIGLFRSPFCVCVRGSEECVSPRQFLRIVLQQVQSGECTWNARDVS